MRQRRGWVFVDVVMAMILTSLVVAILSTAAGFHQRALRHLADLRAANRLAESALISLQSGEKIAGGTGVTVHRISEASGMPGKAWVEVDASVGDRRASLFGLAPENAADDSKGGGS